MSEPGQQGGGQPPGRSGSGLRKTYLGLPGWGWLVIGVAALGTVVYLRLRGGGQPADQGAATVPPGADGSNAPSQYEQISAQLTGLEGTQQALLEAVTDLQGERSRPLRGDGEADERGEDRDRDDLPPSREGGGGTGPPPRRRRPPDRDRDRDRDRHRRAA